MKTTCNKKKTGALIGALLTILICASVAAGFWLTKEQRAYNYAIERLEAGEYEAAAGLFDALGDYGNSSSRRSYCIYMLGKNAADGGDYENAISRFTSISGYSNADEKTKECYYAIAEKYLEEGETENAVSCFEKASGYKDAADRRNALIYEKGHNLFLSEDYDEAKKCFDDIDDDIEKYGYYHFRDFAEAADFIRQRGDMLYRKIEFVIADDSVILENGNVNMDVVYNYLPLRTATVGINAVEGTLFIAPVYFPGHRILYAHKTGDTSILDDDEKEVYESALQIAEEAKRQGGSFERELWIYDWICRSIEYDSPDMNVPIDEFLRLDQLTCIGALRDGKANCQGYADAFYLLASLADLETRKLSVNVGEVGHTINAVKLDETWYVVDASYGDRLLTDSQAVDYGRLNCGWRDPYYSFPGDESVYLWLASETDLEKTYYGVNEWVFDTMEVAAEGLCEQKNAGESSFAYAVVKDQSFTEDALCSYINRVLSVNYGAENISYSIWLDKYGNYSTVTVVWG